MTTIRHRVAKIILFAVAFGFIGFTACIPRSTPTTVIPGLQKPDHCPGGAILSKDGLRCDCPPGTKEENNRCVCDGMMVAKGGWHCEPFTAKRH
jgi:hypothetical protein